MNFNGHKGLIVHRPTEISLKKQPKTHKNPRDSGNSRSTYACPWRRAQSRKNTRGGQKELPMSSAHPKKVLTEASWGTEDLWC